MSESGFSGLGVGRIEGDGDGLGSGRRLAGSVLSSRWVGGPRCVVGGGRRCLFQVFGWDGGGEKGADAVEEGVGAVAGFTGVLFVEVQLGVVV